MQSSHSQRCGPEKEDQCGCPASPPCLCLRSHVPLHAFLTMHPVVRAHSFVHACVHTTHTHTHTHMHTLAGHLAPRDGWHRHQLSLQVGLCIDLAAPAVAKGVLCAPCRQVQLLLLWRWLLEPDPCSEGLEHRPAGSVHVIKSLALRPT